MGKRHLILIAEDEDISRQTLMHVLGDGNDYLEACNGQEALELMEADVLPDLVLLDLIMPVLDGMSVLQHMKQDSRLSGVPVVVCTADGDRASEVKALRAGAEDFIVKPYDVDIVCQRIENTLVRFDAMLERHIAEAKLYEKQIRDVDTQLQGVIKNIPGAIVFGHFDENNVMRITFISDYWEMITGFTAEHYLATRRDNPFADIHPDDIEAARKQYERTVTAHDEEVYTFRVMTKAGAWTWVRLRTSVLHDGTSKRFFGVYTDINEEREQSLMMKGLVESIPGGVGIYRVEGLKVTCEYFSEQLSRLANYDSVERVRAIMDKGNVINDFVYFADRPKLLAAIAKALHCDSVTSIPLRLIGGDGNLVWVNGSAQKIREDGKATIFYVVFTTPSEEALLYRSLVEDAKTGMLVASREDHTILFANEAWRSMRDIKETLPTGGESLREYLPNDSEPLVGTDITELSETEYASIHKTWGNGKQFNISARAMKWNGVDAYVLYINDVTAEYEARDKLLESNTTLQAALEMSHVTTSLVEIQTKTLVFDHDTAESLGVPERLENVPECLIERGIVAPESADVLRALCVRLFAGEKCEADILQRYKRFSDYHWCRVSYVPVVDEDGQVRTAVGASLDIDDQKRREQGYRDQLSMYMASSSKSLASAIINLTKNRVMELRSLSGDSIDYKHTQSVDNLFDYIMDTLIYDPDKQAYSDVFSRTKILELHDKGIDHASARFRANVYEGWLESEYNAMVNPRTGDVEVFIYASDVTTEVRTQQIVNTLTATDYQDIFTIDIETGKTNANFFDVVGSTSRSNVEIIAELQEQADTPAGGVKEFLRQNCLDEDVDQVIEESELPYILDKLKHQPTFISTYSARLPQGGYQRVRVLYARLRGDENVLLCAVQDITSQWEKEEQQKQELQKALSQAEQDSKAKTVFLSNMSHEIRTPLNVITGMTKLAEDIPENPENTKAYLSQIDSSSDYLLSVINDVLDMSRIESGKFDLNPEWVNPYDVLDPCITMMKAAMEQKGVTFVYPKAHKFDGVEYCVDAMRSRQVVMNLLNNAMKFTPKGGTVTLSIQNESFIDNRAVDRVSVSDTGCGMSAEFLERAFEPFEQERNQDTAGIQGTGLGLSLVKNIVERMGGSVTVESTLGEGSTFTFTYPYEFRRHEANKTEETEPSFSMESLEGKHVLLAEDHPLNQRIACELLRKVGITVDVACDGQEAMDMLHAASPHTYDGVLMDIRMPRMDGLQAARAIRSDERSDIAALPIIAMSANAFEEDVAKSLDAGMNAHLAKPVDPNVLFETLARFL